jgi:hypothetical protein
VFGLDFLALYFAIGLFFDIVTLTSVLITTVRLGTTPVAFFEGKSGLVLFNSSAKRVRRGSAG